MIVVKVSAHTFETGWLQATFPLSICGCLCSLKILYMVTFVCYKYNALGRTLPDYVS